MTIRNMAKVNTLIRKGYLFAGVIIAANIFVANEMMAMETNPQEEVTNENNMENEKHEQQKENNENSGNLNKNASLLKRGLNFVLKYENTINFFGGLFFSGFNNYFKWWDYNPGLYCNLRIGCLGLRSKRFLNGMLQFEGNFNLGRGFLWLLLGAYNFIKGFTITEQQERMLYFTPLYVSTLVACRVGNHEFLAKTAFIVVFLLQGFVSMPLTLHFSKFSISIYLDSLIWGMTGMILNRKLMNGQLKIEGEKVDEILIDKNKEKEENDNDDKEKEVQETNNDNLNKSNII